MTPPNQDQPSSSNATSVQYYNTFPGGGTESDEENLPPEYGPFDEIEPLIEPEQLMKIRTLVTAVGLTVLVFTLLISTVAFASLYYHLLMQVRTRNQTKSTVQLKYKPTVILPVLPYSQNNSRLPRWPPASISPLGKYSKAAVAADNEICSEIGRNILLRGGNAVDSAIAALFCIGVMDTHSAGIGGGHFMTIYNASTKECTVIDAREVAPLAATENMYENKWNDSRIGWKAVAVPGELHGLRTEFEKFGSGKVEWKHLLKPTIDLLNEGYPTSHALAKALNQNEARIHQEPTMKNYINPETGRVFQPGEQIKTRKNLLETFRILANSTDPIKDFYEGILTEKIVKEFKENNGILTMDDFKNYRSIIHSSQNVIYTKLKNGRGVCGPPPPSGSAVAQAILNIMDGFEYNMKSFNDIETLYHHFLESSKFSYAARSWLGDPAFVSNATAIAKNITSKEWAEWVRSKITDETHPDDYYGGSFESPPQDHGTTHVSIIDAQGNAVSVTSTINL
uniref:Gamma-glutamyltranspeptidase 1 n=1 Tax=Caenorhabditis tropicalis TaxID=1561998 RepID=A0A1I7U5Y7_9PELO